MSRKEEIGGRNAMEIKIIRLGTQLYIRVREKRRVKDY